MKTITLMAATLVAAHVSVAAPTTPLAHVETSGDGPVAMVLIPGLACDWTVWQSFMERNGDRYTMYAVTLPGMAGADAPPLPADDAGPTPWLDNAVEAVAQLIKEERLETPMVVGHSLGGFLALRLANEHPELVGAAVTVDGLPAIPLGPPDMGLDQRQAMVSGAIEPQMRGSTDEVWFAQMRQTTQSSVTDQDRCAEIIDMAMATGRAVTTEYMLEYYSSDATKFMPNIRVPVHAVAALNDAFAGMGMDRDGLRALWQGQMERAPNHEISYVDSKHFIMDDNPSALDAALAAFVRADQ